MSQDNQEGMVPDQHTGSKTDTQHAVTAASLQEAQALFGMAKERLQNVSNWKTYCGGGADFRLTDTAGHAVDRPAAVGDLFRINIPAPGNASGDGFDWVQIEAIDDSGNDGDSASFAIRVRPTQPPGNTTRDVAHFFGKDATSSFLVERNGMTVTAGVHGRNEKPNTGTGGMLDNVRNTVVALGAMLGLSNPQWKCLVEGLLDIDK